MKQFNTNFIPLGDLMKGIVLRPLNAYRSKCIGYMASSGEYKVGDCVVSDDSHYGKDYENEPRHFALKSYKGHDSYWHLGVDDDGQIWYSPTGCFLTPIESLTDWEITPFKFPSNR